MKALQKAKDVLSEALDAPGLRALSCGFGHGTVVLLQIIDELDASHMVKPFTLDTGLLFDEIRDYWRELEARYDVTIQAVRPELTVAQQGAVLGSSLWSLDPDACCRERKVLPLLRHLESYSVWISGLRKGDTRDHVDHVSKEPLLLKCNPLADWTGEDVATYMAERGLPENPLIQYGYTTVGCVPCTSTGKTRSESRWPGFEKTECGIHKTGDGGSK